MTSLENEQPSARPDKAISSGPRRVPPKMDKYFRAMAKAEASDLHLRPGMPPHIRIRTQITATKAPPLARAETEAMAQELMAEKHRRIFEDFGSVDVAYQVEGSDRFRINIYRQRGDVAMSIRRVTAQIPDFESLHLPPMIAKVAEERQGLVLLSGATGSGKSTTIAAMLEHINQTRACHIVTIEDPIESLFVNKKALVSQREIGIDVANFELALKYLMREDPDVVLIGEMRDHDTFQAALQAAETGHLVFGTVHASTAPQTISRVLDLFSADMREALRLTLALNLRAIICQKLLPCLVQEIDRVPAVEILLTNPTVRQFLIEGREGELPDIIRSHERDGMLTFTRSLLDLIEKNYLDPKLAYEVAPNADELKMLMKGISSSRTGLLGR
ncbi:MAG TPA: PilT/PilU family type 4a pilus ATPase [Phycisphaerae bacterium]|nr:PilT/PilU family type 4a pilus ATPase [Phycisphaerae bacterium]